MRKTSVQCTIAVWICLAAGLGRAAGVDTAMITVDATRPGPAINPRMYGIFLEEINHGVDGGLYGELIRNRAFEDSRPPEGYTWTVRNGRGAWRDGHGFDSGFSRYGYTTNGIPFWSLVREDGASSSMRLETTGGITSESSYCLRIDIDQTAGGRIGVANEGFFGVGVKRGERYRLSLYARCSDDFDASLKARLEDASGAACSTEGDMKPIHGGWKQLKVMIEGTRTEPKARLVITAGGRGTVWLDFVSLFPGKTWKDRPHGLRSDIAQMIADLRPGFVRFPGGCVVEGGTVETAYNWKLTVGPVERRQERWGPWNYRRTQGMGLFEYLQFCEDLKAEPLWVGFVGQTCIFRERENVPMDQMDGIRDNFLDLVEYANGSPRSKWGALRSQAGHRSPFGLEYVEIGNENQGHEYEERYRFVHDALKREYPNVTYLADLSWTSRESMNDADFDIEDHHYYNSPRWFQSRFDLYDDRDRSLPPLYLGEVAVTSNEGGPLRGNLRAALAEGVFLLGCERNADVVRMVSYAPLLAHVEGRTELTGSPPPWHAMIYFNGLRAFGTASYYLWKLFGANIPTHTVETRVTFPDRKPVVVAGQAGVGTWDAVAEFKDVRIESDGRVLYASDFSTGADGWNPDRGRWAAEDGVYRQRRRGLGLSYVGTEDWTNYTLTLKARKLAGSEGFLIIFGRRGEDRYWWNLGGWGNSRHAIEFNQTPVGQGVPGRIERDRWYDIQVVLNGARIRCYLDGQLVHDVVAPETTRFYAVAGQDESRHELILKAINTGAEPVSGMIDLRGVERVGSGGSVTVLTSAHPSDNNSLERPDRVTPSEHPLDRVGSQFGHDFPPHSFTVIRVPNR